MTPTNGFFLIDKPAGWTSFDVCAKVRKTYNIKRVGHTGTLDPFATGLLFVAVGKCTKLIPYLEKHTKSYEATFVLGKTSDTLDPEGEILDCEYTGEIPTWDDIQDYIDTQCLGECDQIPPKYSAIKVNGKRLYKLAREGKEMPEIKARKVTAHEIKILDYSWPQVRLQMTVGAGYYVRSLARDMGVALAGGGYCQSLRRTQIGELDIADAETLDTLSLPIDPQYIIPQTVLEHREIDPARLRDLWEGRAFPIQGTDGDRYLVLVKGKTVGVGEVVHGKLQPRISFS